MSQEKQFDKRGAAVFYSLTRSIIHDCPAIVIDDSLVKIGKKAQRIVALKGATQEDAALILNALRATRCEQSGHIWVGTGDERVVCDDCGIERASTPSHVAQFQLCKDCNWQAACTATRRCDNAPSTTPRSGELDMSPDARLKDAEDDVLRLHREKMTFFERVIELERDLATERGRVEYVQGCLREAQAKASALSATRLLRWVPVTERNPIIDTADEQSAVLVANANIGAVLGAGRFTLQAGNVYAGTDHDGEPVWQIFCPYDSANDVNGGHITLGPLGVTHWLEGCPPAPRENNRADGGKQT